MPEAESAASPLSDAAVFNRRVFAKLEKTLAKDPEADLLSLFPFKYQSRLAAYKIIEDEEKAPCRGSQEREAVVKVEPACRLPEGETQIIFPLTCQVKILLGIETDQHPTLLQSLTRLIKESEVLLYPLSAGGGYVVKCSENIVMKSAMPEDTFTEYTNLQYLQKHRPTIPAPRPHGLITSGNYIYFFMSYIPGVTLAKVWPGLSDSNKLSLQRSINDIFSDLRQIPHPPGSPLGGVAGEGCKDTRRHTRISGLIYTPEEFWDFQYLGAKRSGKIFYEFLSKFTQPHLANEITFSHGDLRDENIIVQDRDGEYIVSGIIDWEMSGFYPADFECTKITNVLGCDENNDWYLHLPSCVSPEKYPIRWLADWAWDPHIA